MLEVLVRLPLAVLAGGLVGFEREWKQKAAGLRTHMIVCLGSATFTLVGARLYDDLRRAGAESTQMDPMRLIAGIIGGIGFLGAGSIIRARGSVRGLTTAGGLWLVGALGVAIGGGDLVTAACAAVLALVVLHGFHGLEKRLSDDGGGSPPAPRDVEESPR
jgi:putative Mg2+ transporter-C (MgtC) family protein